VPAGTHSFPMRAVILSNMTGSDWPLRLMTFMLLRCGYWRLGRQAVESVDGAKQKSLKAKRRRNSA
jgi:hypothetical protein